MTAGEILEQIEKRLWDTHTIEVTPVHPQFLDGSRAEIVPAEGMLYFDRGLDGALTDKLEVVAHELGHLVLHHTLLRSSQVDLLRGSVFLQEGASGLSRYSPRTHEEAEASAFAAELICPATAIFEDWRSDPAVNPTALAEAFGASATLALIQLAEGLYNFAVGVGTEHTADEHSPTPEQERAATTYGVPVLVDAGPGTGKTKTLIRRVVDVLTRGNAAEGILVLTFSNEAAGEVRDRLQAARGSKAAADVLAATFHGFGVMLLHSFGDRVGLGVNYAILDEAAQEELVEDLLGKVECDALLDLADPTNTAVEVTAIIGYLKDRLIGPSELRTAIEQWRPAPDEQRALARARALLRLFEAYEAAKTAQERVDFADLISLPHRLLSQHPDIRDALRAEFPFVLVDEYQDVSRATALLLQQVAGPSNPPWVVGDARQAIYRFRGADPENMNLFDQDFPGAVRHTLRDNYRSSPPILDVANQLARLLQDGTAVDGGAHWRSGRAIEALEPDSVRCVSANSDAAERQGIADVIVDWLGRGTAEEDIAVLARRNVDVRNIAIVLKQRGIKATTTGILTAEGAGGDMAALLSAVDTPAAMSRVIYAIERDSVGPPVLNDVVTQLLSSTHSEDEPPWTGSEEARAIAARAWRLHARLREFTHSGDGWTVLTSCLFFETSYLRRLVEELDKRVDAAVQIDEVLSTLALAARYRFGHPHVMPMRSRRGFTDRLRHLLTEPEPGLIPPRRQLGAIRVMTCHAAKGLEFPCVVVAGQSLPNFSRREVSLPPLLRPKADSDLLQADSLLFVGVTRAQRALVVSHARTAGGTPKSPRRTLPTLLTRWLEAGDREEETWTLPPEGSEEIQIGRVWGGKAPDAYGMYELAKNTCRIRMYLERELGLRFRRRDYSLYPEFTTRVRRILSRCLMAMKEDQALGSELVTAILDEEWPPDLFADHPHVGIYRPRALRWAAGFVQELARCNLILHEELSDIFEWNDSFGTPRRIKLNLVARFTSAEGKTVAIVVQRRAKNGSSSLNWSDLGGHHQLPLVLLQHRDGDVEPFVYFGEDASLRPYNWRRTKPGDAVRETAEAAASAFHNLTKGTFDGVITDWGCDRCAARICCPWWIGAVPH